MKKIITTLLAAATAAAAYAVPAKPGVRTIEQPDGTTLEVILVGDEFRHMYLTADSLPLVKGADGVFEYATLDADGNVVSTGVRASSHTGRRPASERSLVSRLDADATIRARLSRTSVRRQHVAARRSIAQSGMGVFDDSFPREGDVKALVLLVNYKDVKFKTPNPHEYFSAMLMEEGFSQYKGTGSARDYFVENSNGRFRPEFDCYGPVELPKNRSYYGANNSNDEDVAPEDMIIHAVQLLDAEVDFSQYDTNGDGFVDNVYVFYAGEGENVEGVTENAVWPHSYNIYYGAGKVCQADGVKFDYYACSNEWDGSKPDGIGTFVHEFSHVLGLPDLYDVYYENATSVTPGEWDLLDSGSYNNDSRTPPAYSAYERNALGWNEPVVLDGPASVSLEHILYSNQSYLIPTEKTTEFFLLENRQNTGWDKYLPGHGMLVWHIDFDETVWYKNEVNTNRSHQYVDIVEAGGSANNGSARTLAAYPFPGTKSKTSFTSSTTPALKSWAKKAINLPITDIKENNGVITFEVAGGNSGITDAAADGPSLRADGLSLRYNGVSGDIVRVYDLAGRMVAAVAADAAGMASVELPAGVYVATAASCTRKVALH